jgi:FKBP-type peptidyl-prolyl cis-trans isomerase FkpA
MSDQVRGAKPQVELEVYGPKIQALARSRAGAKADQEKARSKVYLDEAAKEPGAVRSDTGMVFRSLKPGSGDSPKPTDRVKVNYEGKLTDGTIFDSSLQRGQPAEFPLSGVIPCWTEGLQKMKVGEKAKLVCPSQIAYGDQGRPPRIPGGATLVFEVELIEIKAAAPPPPISAPATPAPPPTKK